MPILMYDSTTAPDIPADAPAVAGYVDSIYRWSDQDWRRFATARKLRVATRAATNDGHALDVETGDATPDEAPGWARRRIAAGIARPRIYCNRLTWPACQRTCAGLPVRWWIATLDRATAFLLAGSDATQYAGSAQSGGHFDLSLCKDDFFDDITGVAAPAITSGGEGTLVLIPDPNPPGLHRFYIASPHGNVRWSWALGGEGALDDSAGEDIDLGGAGLVPGTLTVALHEFQGRYRFALEALSGDGHVYAKVMDGPDRTVIEDWRPVATAEPVLAPGGEAGPAVTDDHIAEVAVGAVAKQLQVAD